MIKLIIITINAIFLMQNCSGEGFNENKDITKNINSERSSRLFLSVRQGKLFK